MKESPPPIARQILDSSDLQSVRFDAAGLVPVVSQDFSTGNVLMVAWANRDALDRTLATKTLHFWSRSRGELWQKGETSGNTQSLVSLHLDCDGDTVLALVEPTGPACHTGDLTCFGEGASPLGQGSEAQADGETSILAQLSEVVASRDRQRPEGSYTTRLLSDENLRLKKIGEEASELVVALARDEASVGEEAADLVYHLLVALQATGRSWEDVERALAARRR